MSGTVDHGVPFERSLPAAMTASAGARRLAPYGDQPWTVPGGQLRDP